MCRLKFVKPTCIRELFNSYIHAPVRVRMRREEFQKFQLQRASPPVFCTGTPIGVSNWHLSPKNIGKMKSKKRQKAPLISGPHVGIAGPHVNLEPSLLAPGITVSLLSPREMGPTQPPLTINRKWREVGCISRIFEYLKLGMVLHGFCVACS